MSKIPYGITTELAHDDYNNDEHYQRSSSLKLLLKNPELYFMTYIKKEKKVGKEKSKPHFDIGTAIHTRILEPEKFNSTICYFEGLKKGKLFDEFNKLNKGKIILGDLAKLQIENMYSSIMKSKAKEYVTGGVSEVSCFTSLFGVDVKVRADHKKDDDIIDLKSTTGIITATSFKKTVDYLDYDLAAALYVDAFQAKNFYWVVSSKDYDCTRIFKASETMLERGRKKYKQAIENLKYYSSIDWKFENDVVEISPDNDMDAGSF